MGTLLNPSKRTFAGPWLLDKVALEELNEIVEFANQELKKCRHEIIESIAQKDFDEKKYDTLEKAKAYALKHSWDTVRKDIVLISNDESKLKDNSINELLVDPKIKNFRPKELSIDIEYGRENKFSFNVKQRYDGELEYDIKSTKSEIEDKINYKFENWLDKYKPNIIQTKWLQFAFPLALLSGIFSIIFAINIYSTYKPTSQVVYKDKIDNLINFGINEENTAEALDLLLKINSGYVPPDIKEEVKISKTARRITIIALSFCLLGIFKPITIIGVGKDKNKLKLYKKYMKYILFVIPGIFLYPYIIDLIKNWF